MGLISRVRAKRFSSFEDEDQREDSFSAPYSSGAHLSSSNPRGSGGDVFPSRGAPPRGVHPAMAPGSGISELRAIEAAEAAFGERSMTQHTSRAAAPQYQARPPPQPSITMAMLQQQPMRRQQPMLQQQPAAPPRVPLHNPVDHPVGALPVVTGQPVQVSAQAQINAGAYWPQVPYGQPQPVYGQQGFGGAPTSFGPPAS